MDRPDRKVTATLDGAAQPPVDIELADGAPEWCDHTTPEAAARSLANEGAGCGGWPGRVERAPQGRPATQENPATGPSGVRSATTGA